MEKDNIPKNPKDFRRWFSKYRATRDAELKDNHDQTRAELAATVEDAEQATEVLLGELEEKTRLANETRKKFGLK